MANFRLQKKDDIIETISESEEFKKDGFGELPDEKGDKVFNKKDDKNVSFEVEWKFKKEDTVTDNNKKVTLKDRVHTIHLRRDMNKVDRMHEEKKFFIKRTRDNLDACLLRMDSIQKQKLQVEAEIEMEKVANNNATVFRLKDKLQRLCTEMESEKELEAKLSAILKENMENLWHIEVQEGKFTALRESLKVEEANLARVLQQQAKERLSKAKAASLRKERSKALRIQKEMKKDKAYDLHRQKVISEAKRNHKIAVNFLKTTLAKVRNEEAMEEKISQEYMKRRMDAMISLKNNISANRETLRKVNAWSKARANLIKKKEEAEKEAILAEGGDSIKETLHNKQNMELEFRRRIFEEEQQFRKNEIVTRLLKEEAYDEKLKQRQLDLESGKRWIIKAKHIPNEKERTWHRFMNLCEGRTPVYTSVEDDYSFPDKSDRNRSLSITSTESSVTGEIDDWEITQEEETLTEPEIMGLWSETYKPYKEPKDEVECKPVGGTKMEQDILAHTLERLRSGIIHKQVVSGREFKGCPFYSKPELIHFKDFDVGKTYKKKITLINASYTINYCKLVEVEDHLKDFITVYFDPPGPMSAGISCEVFITFKPMINRDLQGRVTFLAQTGAFSVPLQCTTKKCFLALDKELINFGTYVIGETVSRTITLGNAGALGTKFQVHSDIETCDEIRSPNATESTLYSLDDKVTYGKMSPRDHHSDVLFPPSIEIMPVMSPGVLDNLSEEAEHVIISEEPTSEVIEKSPYEDQQEIRLGEITTNDIGPFSSVKIPIVFYPVVPGPAEAKFQITFKNPDCPPLCFKAIGEAVIVPVWVPQPNVDLKICMFDRLYQDAVIIQTRSKAALRLKFEVCKELKNHIELLPETGYIQARSSFSVQLKFLPRLSLPEEAGKYFDKETGVLQAPMIVRVADQKKPVEFTVHAIVTTSDLEIEPKEVNFGYCTIYEAVKAKIIVTNKSFLPQEFGFINIPKYVEIQPNDGFGIILPLESLPLDIIFKPNKAKEYDFQLVCITEINREFPFSCKGIGVHPPLELSHYRVKFAATALYDISTVTLYVINSHLSMNSLTHAVPRIGTGEIAPVGPTSFEFLLPEDAPIMITPSVGTVLPGKKCMIEVAFRPVLPESSIITEALRSKSKELEAKMIKPTGKKEIRKLSTGPLKAAVKWLKPRSSLSKQRRSKDQIKTDSEEYIVAKATLIKGFQKKFHKYVIPCVIASGDIKDKKETASMDFSPYNTLYLELHCPTVPPSIVVASDDGRTVFNFGDIAVGHRGIKKITIQNVCPEYLDLEFSILNPYGPFVLLGPCRGLKPKQSQVIGVSFSPQESNLFLETLEIMSKKGTLTLSLLGKGVASTITCSIEGEVLNMGYVIAGETATSMFKLQNSSTLPINYSIILESLTLTRKKEQLRVPDFTNTDKRTNIIGTQNYNGQSVFSIFPVGGVIESGKSQEFTLTFSPDHESLYYSDRFQVVLFNREISHQILLKGAAREHMMFVEGGDPLDVTVESLTVTHSGPEEERRDEPDDIKGIILSLEYIQMATGATPATRELQVGCIRTSQPTLRKSIEFNMENIHQLQHKGFTVEPSRGSVERGQVKTINVSWVPTPNFDPDQPLVVTTYLVLRGDVKETYRVIFTAHVVSEWILGDSP